MDKCIFCSGQECHVCHVLSMYMYMYVGGIGILYSGKFWRALSWRKTGKIYENNFNLAIYT